MPALPRLCSRGIRAGRAGVGDPGVKMAAQEIGSLYIGLGIDTAVFDRQIVQIPQKIKPSSDAIERGFNNASAALKRTEVSAGATRAAMQNLQLPTERHRHFAGVWRQPVPGAGAAERPDSPDFSAGRLPHYRHFHRQRDYADACAGGRHYCRRRRVRRADPAGAVQRREPAPVQLGAGAHRAAGIECRYRG